MWDIGLWMGLFLWGHLAGGRAGVGRVAFHTEKAITFAQDVWQHPGCCKKTLPQANPQWEISASQKGGMLERALSRQIAGIYPGATTLWLCSCW